MTVQLSVPPDGGVRAQLAYRKARNSVVNTCASGGAQVSFIVGGITDITRQTTSELIG